MDTAIISGNLSGKNCDIFPAIQDTNQNMIITLSMIYIMIQHFFSPIPLYQIVVEVWHQERLSRVPSNPRIFFVMLYIPCFFHIFGPQEENFWAIEKGNKFQSFLVHYQVS